MAASPFLFSSPCSSTLLNLAGHKGPITNPWPGLDQRFNAITAFLSSGGLAEATTATGDELMAAKNGGPTISYDVEMQACGH